MSRGPPEKLAGHQPLDVGPGESQPASLGERDAQRQKRHLGSRSLDARGPGRGGGMGGAGRRAGLEQRR